MTQAPSWQSIGFSQIGKMPAYAACGGVIQVRGRDDMQDRDFRLVDSRDLQGKIFRRGFISQPACADQNSF